MLLNKLDKLLNRFLDWTVARYTRFSKYCKAAYRNYCSKIKALEGLLSLAQKENDITAIVEIETRIRMLRLKLYGIFAFLGFCLLIIVFGV